MYVTGSRLLVASVNNCWCRAATAVVSHPCAKCLGDLHRLCRAQCEYDGPDPFAKEPECDPEVLK
eukprot:2827667-Karenia_brevis.AAC.1